MKERKGIVKKIGIVFGVIIAIFLVINLIWFFGIKIRYMSLTKGIDKVVQTEEEKEMDINNITYEKVEDGYRYLVKETSYLNNSGFACVGKEEGMVIETDKGGNVISDNGTNISLFIWPEMFSGYTFGVDVENVNGWYQINVDKDGYYIEDKDVDPENQEKLKEILENNREEIDKLFDLADKMWDIR
jgi:hypothetical protein